jgi:hypothetical protein
MPMPSKWQQAAQSGRKARLRDIPAGPVSGGNLMAGGQPVSSQCRKAEKSAGKELATERLL